MYKVEEIASKIIQRSADDANSGGELITNLKLQKLLYYHQGFHLALFGKPLFEEQIEAWTYGPVVPSIYFKYQEYGNNVINIEGITPVELDPQEELLFNEVMRVYGAYSAIGLMHMTHNEFPWISTRIGKGSVIEVEKMQQYFKTKLK